MKNPGKVRISILIVVLLLGFGCEDFLSTEPHGTTSFPVLTSELSRTEGLLIAAYSNLDGVSNDDMSGAASNWVFGSIAGGDAYKGGSGTLDQDQFTPVEIHSTLPANPVIAGKWTTYYNGISRANDAIKAFKTIGGISDSFRNERIAEARFLRAYFHFELWKIFRNVPYIDETLEDVRIGNNEDIVPQMQDDFKFASENLPPSQLEVGRITNGAAYSFLGIIKIWRNDFAGAKEYFDLVISSGRYQLNENYHQNFNAAYRSSDTYLNRESILEVEQSVNEGTQGYNGNWGDAYNYSLGPAGCCGFHRPSQNLVNAFKVDDFGLPLLDDYNKLDVTNDDEIESGDPSFTPYNGLLDPRLDWTVGRRGIPYLDWGVHPGRDWNSDQPDYGPYTPIKTMFYQSQSSTESEQDNWIPGLNINNLKLLRYSDLLLYAAEAEVEMGNLTTALELVNQVRARAKKPEGYVHTYVDPQNPMAGFTNTPAANYKIETYPAFPNQDYARKAVRFERRLELGMEGHRFFDLVRWGIAAEEKNAYFEVEKTKRAYLSSGLFTKGTDEILPIPQSAIDLSYKDGKKTLLQNPGY